MHVDEMAAHCIREIYTIQLHAPYHLCAFTAGGLIIFEMVRQLLAVGESVAVVGLLDASSPPEGNEPDSSLGWANLITGGLKIVDILGTHNSIMRPEPHVAGLVRKMDEHLRQIGNGSLSEPVQASC